MIICADLHAREEVEETVFEEVLPGLYQAACTDPDKTITVLGDFWHLRYRLTVRLLNRTVEFTEVCHKAGIYINFLPGNHDQINVDGENALEILGRLPNVKVYTKPERDHWGLWIPYRKDPSDVLAALQLGVTDPPVCWMHHGVLGALMNNVIQDNDGIPPIHFKDWLVFCGHYHKRQKIGTVNYIGSPYQTNANEAGQVKGYATWNAQTRMLTYVDTNWGRRFHQLGVVASEAELAKVLEHVKAGDEVRAILPPGVDGAALSKGLEERGASSILTPQLVAKEQRLDVADNAGFADFAKEYVNQFAGHLDKEKLMSLYQQLCC